MQKRRVDCGDEVSANKTSKGNPIKRFYAVTIDSFNKLQILADQRNLQRETILLCDAWTSRQKPRSVRLH